MAPAPSPRLHALLTGASSPLGQAIARALVPHVSVLHLHVHKSVEATTSLAGELEAAGVSTLVHTADFTEEHFATRLVEGLGDAPLDLLIHNAGLYHRGPLVELTSALVDRLHAVNVRAPLLLTAACLPALRAASGQVILLSDVGGVIPWRHHAAYGSTKAAITWLVRSLALELAPQVRVNGVAPGLITAPLHLDPQQAALLEKRVPLGRRGLPEEVAEAVRWFAAGAPYVTGQVLSVDGGRSQGRGDG